MVTRLGYPPQPLFAAPHTRPSWKGRVTWLRHPQPSTPRQDLATRHFKKCVALLLKYLHIYIQVLLYVLQPRPTKGKMRIHCLENVDKSLMFLNEQRVHLENMGAHDIVDGNPRLTLGLIWTIILRFQVNLIAILIRAKLEDIFGDACGSLSFKVGHGGIADDLG